MTTSECCCSRRVHIGVYSTATQKPQPIRVARFPSERANVGCLVYSKFSIPLSFSVCSQMVTGCARRRNHRRQSLHKRRQGRANGCKHFWGTRMIRFAQQVVGACFESYQGPANRTVAGQNQTDNFHGMRFFRYVRPPRIHPHRK